MKGAVNEEEIKKLDELLHLLVDRNAKAAVPDGLQGLPAVDIAVLGLAAAHPGLLVGEIAQTLGIPNSTLTSSLKRLEQKEIVQRKASLRDQRAFGVTLTDKGAELYQVHKELERAGLERILSRIDSHEERALLFYLLGKMTVAG